MKIRQTARRSLAAALTATVAAGMLLARVPGQREVKKAATQAAERGGQSNARPDESGQMSTSGTGEINKNDADDESSLDAFPKCDDKGRKHKILSC